MSFVVYDLTFLVIFVGLVALFLYRGKKNIKKEGKLLLYKAEWGIKLIHRVGEKYKKTLKFLSYISVTMGYILMTTVLYLFGKIVWIYASNRELVRAVKVPPILPLFPYFSQAFNLDFLPPFYFIYWVIIIAIVAIPHEFGHGIFAAFNKIKIKKTGFGFFPFFFPVFLAAFVEPDEKQTEKKSIFAQMSVLSAGTFANVLTALLFVILLFGFFSIAFAPAGISFDSYATSAVALSSITSINGMPVSNMSYNLLSNQTSEEGFTKVESNNQTYLINLDLVEQQKNYAEQTNSLVVYYSAPAIENNIGSVILSMDGTKLTSLDIMREKLSQYSPGENATLTILNKQGEEENKTIQLGENPDSSKKAWLGIGFYESTPSGFAAKIMNFFSSFRKPNIYYEPVLGELSIFLYHLLWWAVLICISVALVNMLPMGIFDGGRFFYLTILALTKNKNTAKKSYEWMTRILLLLVFLLMVFWFIGII